LCLLARQKLFESKRCTVQAIRCLALCLLALALAAPSLLSARSKAEQNATTIDSGTFSILVGGRKVGTETFAIKQLPTSSVATSEIKIEDGGSKARQTSELRLSPKGELQHYEWHELAPGKNEIVVEPQEDFLVERITSETEKKFEQPFLMPLTTMVLDDFFFSDWEILTWRYLASICKTVNGATQCVPQKSQFGVIVPRQHASMVVSIEFIGRDHMPIHGTETELSHYRISSEEASDWDLWFDGNQKLVRILIPATKMEVLRD
jgi:hypothetical protein